MQTFQPAGNLAAEMNSRIIHHKYYQGTFGHLFERHSVIFRICETCTALDYGEYQRRKSHYDDEHGYDTLVNRLKEWGCIQPDPSDLEIIFQRE